MQISKRKSTKTKGFPPRRVILCKRPEKIARRVCFCADDQPELTPQMTRSASLRQWGLSGLTPVGCGQLVKPEDSRLQRVLSGAIHGPRWSIRFETGISLEAVFGFTSPSILQQAALGAAFMHDSASLVKPTNLGAWVGVGHVRRTKVGSRRNQALCGKTLHQPLGLSLGVFLLPT